jgi:hypothetical protein
MAEKTDAIPTFGDGFIGLSSPLFWGYFIIQKSGSLIVIT